MSEAFTVITLIDGNHDNDAILKVFSDISEGKRKNDIRFLNYYHEVPVSFDGVVDNVSDDRVQFKVHQSQAVVMKFEKFTLIKSSHFPSGHAVHAYTAYVNVQKSTAVLTRFAYAQIKAERRGAVRVSVEGRCDATFQSEFPLVHGKVKDISLTGVSILVKNQLELEKDTFGMLEFKLNGKPLSIEAFFLKTIDNEDGQYCIFRYEVEGKVELEISQFIYSRQVEIIRDLKDNLY